MVSSPSKTDIEAIFHRLRAAAPNKVGWHILLESNIFEYMNHKPNVLLVCLLTDLLRLQCQEPNVGDRYLRRIHLHRLLGGPSQSGRPSDICAVHQSGHQLDMDADSPNAIGRQRKRGAVLPAAQLQHHRRAAKVQFAGGPVVSRQIVQRCAAGNEDVRHGRVYRWQCGRC